MQTLDLNLLVALDCLLETGSVSAAADKMHLSTPAMSRTLGRIRDAFGDPILIRAGRSLVPTPRAQAMRERVRSLVEQSRALLSDSDELAASHRVFTVRAADVSAGFYGSRLLALLREQAPHVSLRFAPESDEDAQALRDGRVDLDIGANDLSAPELRVQTLYRERFVGVVRKGHALSRGKISVKRFVSFQHVGVSRRGQRVGPIDRALSPVTRDIAMVLPSWYAAVRVIEESDLVGAMPEPLALQAGLYTFPLPVKVPDLAIAQTWHPRFDADAAHQLLRECVRRSRPESETARC